MTDFIFHLNKLPFIVNKQYLLNEDSDEYLELRKQINNLIQEIKKEINIIELKNDIILITELKKNQKLLKQTNIIELNKE